MTAPTEQDVLRQVAAIDLNDVGLTPSEIETNVNFLRNGTNVSVQVLLEVPPNMSEEQIEALQAKAETALRRLGDTSSISVVIAAHVLALKPEPELKPNEKPKVAPEAKAPEGKRKKKQGKVKNTIVVASGKGGVGKSLVAVNLALALAFHHGLKVGVMDADVQGPSVPQLMGIRNGMEQNEADMVLPQEKYVISTMSIGYMMDEGQPAIWRGPMMHKAIGHMVHDVEWGNLDVLIVDTPPGTGDVQLSLNSQMQMDGAVIVSTPQELALADARRGIGLFNQMNVPVMGIVENMSAPSTGPNFFGEGGAELEAAKQGVDFLGKIPLDVKYMQTSDKGTPIVALDPHAQEAKPYKYMAKKLRPRLRFI